MTIWQSFESEEQRKQRALKIVNKVPYRRERLWQFGLAFLAIFTVTLIWFVNWMAKQ